MDQNLNNLVFDIHKASSSLELWPDLFERVGKHLGAEGLAISSANPLDVSTHRMAPVYGFDDAELANYMHNYNSHNPWILDPLRALLAVQGDVTNLPLRVDEMTDRAMMERHHVYNEALKPMGISDLMGCGLTKNNENLYWMSFFCGSGRKKRFSDDDESMARMLTNHLVLSYTRAVQIDPLRPFLATGDISTITQPTFCIDPAFNLLRDNTYLVSTQNHHLTVKNGKVILSHKTLQKSLKSLIADDMVEPNRVRNIEQRMTVPLSVSTKCVVYSYANLAHKPVYLLIFNTDPLVSQHLLDIQHSYHIPPAAAEVLYAQALGIQPTQIREMRNISVETYKWYNKLLRNSLGLPSSARRNIIASKYLNTRSGSL